jgi:hypothetical protein
MNEDRTRLIWLAGSMAVMLAVFSLAGTAFAQSQAASSTPPQQQEKPATQTQTQPMPATQPKRIPVPTVADIARDSESRLEDSAPQKVFTNDDTAGLSPGGISIVGPLPLPPGAAKPLAKPVDPTAQQAAYWKARFTAARQKLVQDKKALPALQNQLEAQRVWEDPGDPDSGQLYSDYYMDMLHQIDAMKVAIQNDKKALSDLYDEFHHAGGLPGWIR